MGPAVALNRADTAVSDKFSPHRVGSVVSMFNAITHSQIFVTDQDKALEFYVGTLGMEVTADVDMGFMRWLTVSVAGQPGHQIRLEVPGPPAMSPETAEQARELLAKGAMGGSFILTTGDCRKTYQTLLDKGVDFTEEPTERPYGIDCALRDPFGNAVRITQLKG